MIYGMLDDVLRALEHTIELMQDANVDSSVVLLLEDAKEALEDQRAEEQDGE
jgi:hypothetical protein